jgi:hypothetical protein
MNIIELMYWGKERTNDDSNGFEISYRCSTVLSLIPNTYTTVYMFGKSLSYCTMCL